MNEDHLLSQPTLATPISSDQNFLDWINILRSESTKEDNEADQLDNIDDTDNYMNWTSNSSEPLQEQVLSQKLSQLSTSDQPTEHQQMSAEDMEPSIPLCLSKGSKSFQKIVSHIASDDMIEELRQMAILIYRISRTNLEKSLWLTYFEAGTGNLKTNQINTDHAGLQIWFKEVQSITKRKTNRDDHATCLAYVTQYLRELGDKLELYQTEWNFQMNQLSNYLPTIETFVQQELELVCLETKRQIALVQFHYNNHVFEFEYLRHHPTKYQKQIAQELSHAKYQEEISREDYNFLRQCVSTYQSSGKVELPHETSFNQIENGRKRLKLHDQYRNVAQQARENVTRLCLSSAENQMDRYCAQLNRKLKQFWFEQRSLPTDQKLTVGMINLIEQCCKNISDCVKCVYEYKYKLDLVHLNSADQLVN